jgi:hypothetical protein
MVRSRSKTTGEACTTATFEVIAVSPIRQASTKVYSSLRPMCTLRRIAAIDFRFLTNKALPQSLDKIVRTAV